MRADVVTLAHALCGVMALPEELEEVLEADDLGIEDYEHDFSVAGISGADRLIGRIRCCAAGIADRGGVHAIGFPKETLGAPETSETEYGLLHMIGKRLLQGLAIDKMFHGDPAFYCSRAAFLLLISSSSESL